MYYGRKARPCVNRIVVERTEQENYRKHRQRLSKVKSTIDTGTPRMFKAAHLRVNRKKEVMLEERYSDIERENRLLLRKMSAILNGPPTTVTSARKLSRPKPSNKALRRRELARITEENQAILHRIQTSHATYNSAVWEEEAKVAQRRMESICFHKRRPGSGLGARSHASRGSASAASLGSRPRKARPVSAPTHRRAMEDDAYARHHRLQAAHYGGDLGPADVVGPASRRSRPQSAHPRYSAWRNDAEKAEVARGLHTAIAEVEEEFAEHMRHGSSAGAGSGSAGAGISGYTSDGSDGEPHPGDGPVDMDAPAEDGRLAASAAGGGGGGGAGATSLSVPEAEATAWAAPRRSDE